MDAKVKRLLYAVMSNIKKLPFGSLIHLFTLYSKCLANRIAMSLAFDLRELK